MHEVRLKPGDRKRFLRIAIYSLPPLAALVVAVACGLYVHAEELDHWDFAALTLAASVTLGFITAHLSLPQPGEEDTRLTHAALFLLRSIITLAFVALGFTHVMSATTSLMSAVIVSGLADAVILYANL